ncbi:MAG: hypothetical protein AB7G21_05145, partial [Dehalococcoidia bacterium]
MQTTVVPLVPGRRRAGMRWLWTPATGGGLTAIGAASVTLSGAAPVASCATGAGRRVEDATTNLVVNPSFETGLTTPTQWDTTNTGTALTRVSSWSASGAWAVEVACDGLNVSQGIQTAGGTGGMPVVAGQPYTAQVRTSLVSGAGSLRLDIVWYDGAGAFLASSTGTLAGAGGEQTWTVSGTAPVSTAYAALALFGAGQTQAIVFAADAFQLEAAATPSSYCDGSLGDGYAWSGTAHGSASTRDATRLLAAAVPFDLGRGTLAAWVRPAGGGGDGAEHGVFDGDAGGIEVSLIATAAGGWRLTLGASTVEVTQAHAADADVVLLARWEPGRLR